jgi:hypothetical protein
VIRRLALGAAAVVLFALVATANSGGYRYGISDQAFYLPAIEKSLDPDLFPRDSPILQAQMRLWLGDEVAAFLARGAAVNLPLVAAVLYASGLVLLAGAVTYFARGLGASQAAVIVALALATIRHHIAKTGANSLEGYFHPRMLAYALGIWALGCVLRRRFGAALVLVALMGLIHTTAFLWFAAAVVVAGAWSIDRRLMWGMAAGLAVVAGLLATVGPRMDAAWLTVVAEKDYLFPSAWPLHAWVLNFTYPVVLWAIYRRRAGLGRTAPGEGALVVGLLVLVAGFLVSVPLSALRVALAVQLQVTRVFWVLDAVVFIYLAWWIIDDLGATRGARWRAAAAAVVIALPPRLLRSARRGRPPARQMDVARRRLDGRHDLGARTAGPPERARGPGPCVAVRFERARVGVVRYRARGHERYGAGHVRP